MGLVFTNRIYITGIIVSYQMSRLVFSVTECLWTAKRSDLGFNLPLYTIIPLPTFISFCHRFSILPNGSHCSFGKCQCLVIQKASFYREISYFSINVLLSDLKMSCSLYFSVIRYFEHHKITFSHHVSSLSISYISIMNIWEILLISSWFSSLSFCLRINEFLKCTLIYPTCVNKRSIITTMLYVNYGL